MKRVLSMRLFTIIHVNAFAADSVGRETYQLACSHCHSPTLAKGIGAPAAFDKKAWKERFKQASLAVKNHPQRYKTPMSYLLTSVIKGKNLMHHGGLCKESASAPEKHCSTEAFVQAIQYMSGQS